MQLSNQTLVKIVNGEIVRKVKVNQLRFEELRAKVAECAGSKEFVLVLLDPASKRTPVYSQQELEEVLLQVMLGTGVLRVSFDPLPRAVVAAPEPSSEEAEKKKKILERLERGRECNGNRLAFLEEVKKVKAAQSKGETVAKINQIPEFVKEKILHYKKRMVAKRHLKDVVEQLFNENEGLEEDPASQQFIFEQSKQEILEVLRRHAQAAQRLTPSQKSELEVAANLRMAEQKAKKREAWGRSGFQGARSPQEQQVPGPFERPPQPTIAYRGFDYPHIEESFMLPSASQGHETEQQTPFNILNYSTIQENPNNSRDHGFEWV